MSLNKGSEFVSNRECLILLFFCKGISRLRFRNLAKTYRKPSGLSPGSCIKINWPWDCGRFFSKNKKFGHSPTVNFDSHTLMLYIPGYISKLFVAWPRVLSQDFAIIPFELSYKQNSLKIDSIYVSVAELLSSFSFLGKQISNNLIGYTNVEIL